MTWRTKLHWPRLLTPWGSSSVPQESPSRVPGTQLAFICGRFCSQGQENCGYHLKVDFWVVTASIMFPNRVVVRLAIRFKIALLFWTISSCLTHIGFWIPKTRLVIHSYFSTDLWIFWWIFICLVNLEICISNCKVLASPDYIAICVTLLYRS